MVARKRNRWALALGLLAVPPAASAHDADVIYVQPRETADRVTVAATMTGQTLALLAPVDRDGDGLLTQADADLSSAAIRLGFWQQSPLTGGGAPCALQATRASVRPSDVLLEADFRCAAGELAQDFRVLSVLPKNYSVALGANAASKRSAAQFPRTTITYRAGPGAAVELPPPPVWTWGVFLLGPCALMLFERRRF
jgi:hypothetical protein